MRLKFVLFVWVFLLTQISYGSTSLPHTTFDHMTFKLNHFLPNSLEERDGTVEAHIIIDTMHDGTKRTGFYYVKSRNPICEKKIKKDEPLLSISVKNSPKNKVETLSRHSFWYFHRKAPDLYFSDNKNLDHSLIVEKNHLTNRKGELLISIEKEETLGQYQVCDTNLKIIRPGGETFENAKKVFSPTRRRMESPSHGKNIHQEGVNISFENEEGKPTFLLKEVSKNHYYLSFTQPFSPLEAFFIVISVI